MKHYEEALQKNIEQGKTGSGPDEAAYEAVFNALRKEPDHLLPASFADKVTTTILAKQRRKAWAWEHVWLALGFAVLLAAFIVLIPQTQLKIQFGLKLDFGFLKAMAGYKGLFIFMFCFIIFLQWLDRRVIRNQKYQAGPTKR